jgi:DNA adenine methylase
MENKKRLRPPLTYYGGKQTLAPAIISLIPEDHVLYGEPFFGGGAVFFMKEPSEVEVINDTNRELVNFYRIAKSRFKELQALIHMTLHSRDAHHSAKIIYNNPQMFDEVKRAWAVWTLSTQGFSGQIDGPFGFDKTSGSTAQRIAAKRGSFTDELMARLEHVQIECADALYVIQSRDHKGAFFYCDPPYIGTHLGHYKGYTEADFEALLLMLAGIEGRFLLSSYPSGLLENYSKVFGWHTIKKEMTVSVNIKAGNPKKKTEVLTANYPITDVFNRKD